MFDWMEAFLFSGDNEASTFGGIACLLKQLEN